MQDITIAIVALAPTLACWHLGHQWLRDRRLQHERSLTASRETAAALQTQLDAHQLMLQEADRAFEALHGQTKEKLDKFESIVKAEQLGQRRRA